MNGGQVDNNDWAYEICGITSAVNDPILRSIDWAYTKTGSTSTDSNACDAGIARNCFYSPVSSVGIVTDVVNAVKPGGRCFFAAASQQINNLCFALLGQLTAGNLTNISIDFVPLVDGKIEQRNLLIVTVDVSKVNLNLH